MKKNLIVLALVLVSFANAQKGTYLVSGNFLYYQMKNDSKTLNSFLGFSPKIGYQFKDNWTAGIDASFSTSKTGIGDSYDNETNAYSVGGFLRYSKPLSDFFVFYADLSTGYNNSKITDRYNGPGLPPNNETNGDGFYFGILPAISLNISKGYALNFSVGGLSYRNMNYDDGSSSEGTQITFGQSVVVGISKNF